MITDDDTHSWNIKSHMQLFTILLAIQPDGKLVRKPNKPSITASVASCRCIKHKLPLHPSQCNHNTVRKLEVTPSMSSGRPMPDCSKVMCNISLSSGSQL